ERGRKRVRPESGDLAAFLSFREIQKPGQRLIVAGLDLQEQRAAVRGKAQSGDVAAEPIELANGARGGIDPPAIAANNPLAVGGYRHAAGVDGFERLALVALAPIPDVKEHVLVVLADFAKAERFLAAG